MPTLSDVAAYIRQPTTIIGLGTIVSAAAGYASKTFSPAQAITAACGGVAMIAIPEKPAVQADVKQAVADGMAAVADKGSAGSVAAITADLVKLASDFPPGTLVVPVAPMVAPTYQVAAPVAARVT